MFKNDEAMSAARKKGGLLMFATKHDIPYCIAALITMIVASAGSPIQTQLYGKAFDKLSKYMTSGYEKMGDFVADVRLLCGLIMVVGVVRMLFTWLSIHLWLYIGERQQERARTKLLSNLMRQNLAWYERKENLMGTMAQVNRCIEEVRDALSENIALLTQATSSIILLLISAMISSWALTLVILASAPLMALSSVIFGRLTFRFASRENDLSAKASKILDWSFVSGNLVRLLNGKYRDLVNFNRVVDLSAKAFTKMSLAISLNQLILRVLSFLIFVQGFWFGSYMVSIGKLRIGQVFSSFSSCLLLGTHVSTVANVLALLNKGQAAAATIADFMELEEVEDSQTDELEKVFTPIVLGKSLSFKDVCFTYDGAEAPSLKGVTFTLTADKLAFIVGASGCGKSTLVSLLMRFYKPSSGSIEADDHDISTLSDAQVSNFITLVETNALVFDRLVYDNITLGNQDVPEERAVEACEFAELGPFINSLENGIHLKISTTLSGGQMQRISIARAYIKNSPILVLDEALTAIDHLTRRKLYEKIRKWRKGRMTLVITHELLDIEEGDFVVSLKDGMVMRCEQQEGTQKELTHESDLITKLVDVFEDSESIFTDGLLHKTVKVGDIEAGETDGELQILTVFAILKNCYHTIQSKLIILLGLFFSLMSGVITPVLSFCFSKLLSNVVDESTKRPPKEHGAVFWSSIVIGLILIDGIAYFTSHASLLYASEQWIVELRKKALVIINDQSMSFFANRYLKPADLTALLMNDSRDLRNLVSEFLSAVLSLVALTLLGMIWSIVSGWKLALVGTAFGPLILSVTISYGMVILVRFETSYKDKVCEVEKFNHNAVLGVKTIKAFGLESDFTNSLETKLAELSSVAKLRACFTGLGFALLEMCTSIATGTILYYGLYLVARFEYSYQSMLQVLTLLTFTMTSASTLMSSLPEIARGQRAGTLFARLLSLEADPVETSGTEEIHRFLSNGETFMSFENVDFSYHGSKSTQKKVLQGLSFDIRRGEVVGIVGASGSGKSTIALVMGRLMDCDRGFVKFNSKHLKSLDPMWYRKNVLVVPQRPKFFEGTIWENLTYGFDRAYVDKAFLVECLKLCNIWDLVSSLQQGLDTILDERTVSSGQLQRLCIARALIREPKMIVFDECTSNLDQTNSEIFSNLINVVLKKEFPDLTIVVITHDVSIMKQLPRLLVLESGRVSQDGDFETLSQQAGELKRLTT